MAVGKHQIRPAVQVRVQELGPEPQQPQAGVAQIEFARRVDEHVIRLLDVEDIRLIVKGADVQVQSPVAVPIPGGDPHGAMRHAVAIERQADDQSLFDEAQLAAGPCRLIGKEEIGHAVVRDKQAQPAGPVEIGCHHTQPLAAGQTIPAVAVTFSKRPSPRLTQT